MQHVSQSIKSRLNDLSGEIHDELNKAQSKFPLWPTDPIHALGIGQEEAGELQQAILEFTYEPHKDNASKEQVRKEAIQVAAMAYRFLLHLDQYKFTPSEQTPH
jgi:hypothetical protein